MPAGNLAGLLIQHKHLSNGLWMVLRGSPEALLLLYAGCGEGDAAGEKRLDRDFIRRIEGDAVRPSRSAASYGQPEAGKRSKSGVSKSSWPSRAMSNTSPLAFAASIRSGYVRA